MYTSRNALRNKMVANVSQWGGDPDLFVEALTEAGFLNEIDDALELHDWYDYAGKLMETRKANRERQRRYRESQKQQEANVERNANVTRDVTVTKSERHAPTVPNHTVPNHTNNKTLVTPVERRELREFAKGREEGFLEWWNEYPRKGDKKRTRKVWEKLFPLKEKPERLEQTLQNLWLHTEAYKREVVGKEKQYIKLPATFLNAIDVSEPPE